MNHPSINDCEYIHNKQTWKTKSNGELQVLFNWDSNKRDSFFNNDLLENSAKPNIEGFRSYVVSNLQKNEKGGGEFHKKRQEIFTILTGKITMTIEDLEKNTKTIELEKNTSITILPGILHSYTVEEDNTSFVVVANTTFDPENKDTHDTYSLEEFKVLQNK